MDMKGSNIDALTPLGNSVRTIFKETAQHIAPLKILASRDDWIHTSAGVQEGLGAQMQTALDGTLPPPGLVV